MVEGNGCLSLKLGYKMTFMSPARGLIVIKTRCLMFLLILDVVWLGTSELLGLQIPVIEGKC